MAVVAFLDRHRRCPRGDDRAGDDGIAGIVDLGVFAIDKTGSGMTLLECADGVGVDEIRAKTQAAFTDGTGRPAAAAA